VMSQPATDSVMPDRTKFSAGVSTAGFSSPPTSVGQLSRWMEDMDARSRINQYFASRGFEQRQLRQNLVNWFRTSRLPGRHLRTLMDVVRQVRSEARLEAAIDLLRLLGSPVVRMAVQTAMSRRAGDTADYILAMAAGAMDPSLLWLFQHSPNDAYREAVVNLVDDLPADEGRPFLLQLASDPSPSVRRLALLAMSD